MAKMVTLFRTVSMALRALKLYLSVMLTRWLLATTWTPLDGRETAEVLEMVLLWKTTE